MKILLYLFTLLFFSRCVYCVYLNWTNKVTWEMLNNLFMNILIFSVLIIFCTSCATTQYIPSTQIKPVYPQMHECPNLPQATRATYWQIVNVDVPAMYYQCKADHDAVMQWIDKQKNK